MLRAATKLYHLSNDLKPTLLFLITQLGSGLAENLSIYRETPKIDGWIVYELASSTPLIRAFLLRYKPAFSSGWWMPKTFPSVSR